MIIQLAQVLIYIPILQSSVPYLLMCCVCVMFVMFRFELKLSVTISNWVTSYTLHGVGLC